MTRVVLVLLATAAIALASTCKDTPRGSTLGAYGREARFPLYFTVVGEAAGEGELYRIDEHRLGEEVRPTRLATGLDFPTSVAVDLAGVVYVAETLPAPDGRVRKLVPGREELEPHLDGLDFPVGVVVDSFGQLYVLEAGEKVVKRMHGSGETAALPVEDMGNPRAATMDAGDTLFLVELAPALLTKIIPGGAREVLASELTQPSGIAVSPLGDVYALAQNTGAADGELLRLDANGALTRVAGDLVSPMAVAFEATGALYVVEGHPANRILRVSPTTGAKALVVATGANPYALAFSPF